MKKKYREAFEDFPVIAAIRNDADLEECLKTECQNVFILYGSIMTIHDIVQKITDAGKYAFVHMDMIEGLAGKEVSVDFIKNTTSADGIISTIPSAPIPKWGRLIRRAISASLLSSFNIEDSSPPKVPSMQLT